MVKDMIFSTVGGLALFLIGMGMMSDGLKKAAGQKLKQLLESMTKRSLMGFMVGAAVTALIQSSSATTVIVIGLVNAALLTLRQAICVIIGTNVGTTVTAWIVSLTGLELEAFKISHYALPAIAIGFLTEILSTRRRSKSIGQILTGLGILFIGLSFMKDAFAGLEESQAVIDYLGSLGDKPLLALLAGVVLTLLLQSSSASIAIVQLLAINGAFGSDWVNALHVAIPFVLGSNIGTTITAQIAAFRTNLGARRTAWAHTLFNVVGAVIVLPFVYWGWFGQLVLVVCPWELGPKSIAATIAVAHTVFNISNSAVFLPLAGVLETLVIRLIPEKPGDAEARPVILEEHLLDTPVIALEQARREILRMTERAKKAFHGAVVGILESDRKLLAKVAQIEDTIDEFQSEITSYLVSLSRRQLSDEVSVELPVLLHTVNDLERVGDHAVNIVEVAQRKIEQNITFSESAHNEAEKLKAEIDEMFECISAALGENDTEAARRALINEENINRMQIDFRRSHVQRMTDSKCSPLAGLIFIDLVDNIEKVGDHLTNIAQAVMGGLHWDGFEAGSQHGGTETTEKQGLTME